MTENPEVIYINCLERPLMGPSIDIAFLAAWAH